LQTVLWDTFLTHTVDLNFNYVVRLLKNLRPLSAFAPRSWWEFRSPDRLFSLSPSLSCTIRLTSQKCWHMSVSQSVSQSVNQSISQSIN